MLEERTWGWRSNWKFMGNHSKWTMERMIPNLGLNLLQFLTVKIWRHREEILKFKKQQLEDEKRIRCCTTWEVRFCSLSPDKITICYIRTKNPIIFRRTIQNTELLEHNVQFSTKSHQECRETGNSDPYQREKVINRNRQQAEPDIIFSRKDC